jgi:hypothetical protein
MKKILFTGLRLPLEETGKDIVDTLTLADAMDGPGEAIEGELSTIVAGQCGASGQCREPTNYQAVAALHQCMAHAAKLGRLTVPSPVEARFRIGRAPVVTS